MKFKYIKFRDLNDLLEKARELMGDELFHIFLSDVKIRIVKDDNIKRLGGLYKRDFKEILVYNDYLETFFHELGHHVFQHPKFARFFHFPYLWQAFESYKKTNYDFLGHQAKCHLEEFFAEIFSMFFCNYDHLKSYDFRLAQELEEAIQKIIDQGQEYIEVNIIWD